jgi:hypothetical protein
MHDTPGAIELLKETHGERIPTPHPRLTHQEDDRYRSEVSDAGQMAKWLPNVKVRVCAGCNNGWMGQLEERVK